MSDDVKTPDVDIPGRYPEEDELQKFIQRRKQTGSVWQLVFQVSLIVAILALTALLYNIINGAFGYVVVQNQVDPASLVITTDSNRMLNATNTVSSEDDNELVEGIEGNPNAIGFFGFAFTENAEGIRPLSVDGVAPTAETAQSGEYPLSRPLFIYTADTILEEKPQIAAFANYYLRSVNDVVEEIGYFPVSESVISESQQAAGLTGEVAPETVPAEDIIIAGSSTVYPLTRQMAIEFRRAGFGGGIDLQQTGSTAGLSLFCAGDIDIANASRSMNRAELEACQDSDLSPLEFRVGIDALAVAVSTENDFLDNVTQEELREIFTGAENWSDVNPAWPNEPIERFIPGADSGTLDFFAETIFTRSLEELSKTELIALIQANVSEGRFRALQAQNDFESMGQAEIYQLVLADVVEQRVIKSWNLYDSFFNQAEIDQAVAETPQGEKQFRSWLSIDFLTTPQSSVPELAGIRTAIFGSLWVIFITVLFSLPIGVGAAIYLEEYAATVGNPILRRINSVIQTNINNLAGVPSIIYGMLGLAIFVRALEPITSGALFGATDPTTANGRTIVSASLTLGLLILPLIIINAQEAIRAVPQSLRQAGMGLGATKWQTIWAHVLPNAIPGILTGNILAMSRAIGETAPLVVVGAATFITVDPEGPFAKFTVLPIQIYQWTARPQDEFRHIAAAAIIVLLILLLTLNATAVLLRNRYSKPLS